MADYRHTMTHTHRMDGEDISAFKPLSNKFIVKIFEDKMLKLGNTDLILGWWEDNRNNAHWFGEVIAKHPNVDLSLGDEVYFSFLKAKSNDRILADGILYIILDVNTLIMAIRGGEYQMYNDHILATYLDPEKHSFLEYGEVNKFYRRVEHSNSEGFKHGDVVYYWTDKEFILEGLNKQLDVEYTVIKGENILLCEGKLVKFRTVRLLPEYIEPPVKEKVEGEVEIIIPDTIEKKLKGRGRVIESNCDIAVDSTVYYQLSKAEPCILEGVEYGIIEERYITACYENA